MKKEIETNQVENVPQNRRFQYVILLHTNPHFSLLGIFSITTMNEIEIKNGIKVENFIRLKNLYH